MVPVHTDALALEGTVVRYAGGAVLVVHALGTPVLPVVTDEGVGTFRVILQIE